MILWKGWLFPHVSIMPSVSSTMSLTGSKALPDSSSSSRSLYKESAVCLSANSETTCSDGCTCVLKVHTMQYITTLMSKYKHMCSSLKGCYVFSSTLGEERTSWSVIFCIFSLTAVEDDPGRSEPTPSSAMETILLGFETIWC